MGDKRLSIRTLPDGYYKVTHHPPDDAHPQGKQVLLPGQSRLKERLLAAREDNKAKLAELHEAHYRKVAVRRASLAAHPAVPAEKRCC